MSIALVIAFAVAVIAGIVTGALLSRTLLADAKKVHDAAGVAFQSVAADINGVEARLVALEKKLVGAVKDAVN